MFAEGQGVTADLAEAVNWFRKAADNNNPVAQFNMGTYLAHGIGTAKDLPEAAYWLSRATAQHHEHAAANLEFVLKQLTTSERQELDRRLSATPHIPQQQDKSASIQ
jgi:TPR repeat protein